MENIKELKITYKDGSELNYNIDGFTCKVQGEDSFSHVLVNSNEIKAKVNECDVEKADVSELKCDTLFSVGNIDTTSVSINTVPLEEIVCCKSEKSVYQEVMEYVTNELSDELWDIYNTSEEEQVCLECLVEYYLEKAYSEGYKEAVKFMSDRINDVKEELLFDVAEAGYED